MPARKATEEEQKKWWVESEVGQITCLHLPFKLLVENTLTDLISEGDKLAQEIENTPEHISGITLVGDAGPETNLREVRFGTHWQDHVNIIKEMNRRYEVTLRAVKAAKACGE